MDDPVKTQLHSKLNDFSSLTRNLLEVINADKTSAGGAKTTDTGELTLSVVLDKLIERDREIQGLVETAMEMRARQRDIDWYETQIDKRKTELEDLQNRLYDAEKLLELTVHQGKQKLDSIEKAQEGAVSPEKLIRYAHKISQASTAVSPVGWQPSDPRRPYPQDTEMRAGILGRLSTTGKLSSDDTEGDSSGKGAIGTPSIGMNQNNNQSMVATIKSEKQPNTAGSSYQKVLHAMDQEPMSEDTSLSSSDEGM